MKRQLFAGVGREDLLEWRSLIDERLSEDGWLVTKQVFSLGDDFLQTELMNAIIRILPFRELRRLGQVCKQWASFAMKAEHINFGLTNWPSSFYSVWLGKYFTHVTSIKSHACFLRNCYSDDWNGFGRIRSLEIEELGPYEKLGGELDLYNLSSLETLILPYSFENEIVSLSALTTLTTLRCSNKIFDSIDDLYALENLTSLSCIGFPIFCEFASDFPHLRWLESDFPGHFTGFNGTGILDADLEYDEDLTLEEENEITEAFEYYQRRAYRLSLKGEWKNGVFSGIAKSIQYCDEEEKRDLIMKGTMLNGKFHGSDIREIEIEKKYLYKGQYENGVKHGPGVVYTWPKESHYYLEDDLIPVREEYWKNGVQIH